MNLTPHISLTGAEFEKETKLSDLALSNLQQNTLIICSRKGISNQLVTDRIKELRRASLKNKGPDRPSEFVYQLLSRWGSEPRSKDEITEYVYSLHTAAVFFFADRVKLLESEGLLGEAGANFQAALEFYAFLHVDPYAYIKLDRSSASEYAVKKRHKHSPAQEDKKYIKACYDDWEAGKRTYKSRSAFVRAMAKECTHLSVNYGTVSRWIQSWRK